MLRNEYSNRRQYSLINLIKTYLFYSGDFICILISPSIDSCLSPFTDNLFKNLNNKIHSLALPIPQLL